MHYWSNMNEGLLLNGFGIKAMNNALLVQYEWSIIAEWIWNKEGRWSEISSTTAWQHGKPTLFLCPSQRTDIDNIFTKTGNSDFPYSIKNLDYESYYMTHSRLPRILPPPPKISLKLSSNRCMAVDLTLVHFRFCRNTSVENGLLGLCDHHDKDRKSSYHAYKSFEVSRSFENYKLPGEAIISVSLRFLHSFIYYQAIMDHGHAY